VVQLLTASPKIMNSRFMGVQDSESGECYLRCLAKSSRKNLDSPFQGATLLNR
jgi:hypothetical protein